MCYEVHCKDGSFCAGYTVETHHTTSPSKRPPLWYDYFLVARTKAYTFSYLKTPRIRPPRYYDQRPPFGVLSPYFLDKITPSVRPVKCLKQRRSQSKLTDFFKTVWTCQCVTCCKLQYWERLFRTFHQRPYPVKELKDVTVFSHDMYCTRFKFV